MSRKYKRYDPNQTYLLPQNPKEWLPEGHLALFIQNVVTNFLDLSPIFDHYERSGMGAPPYHPAMMTELLFYGYCVSVRSSRRMAKAIEDDVAFRVLAAGNLPDFRTISDFRKIHIDALKPLFVQVVLLCEQAGLVTLGTVSIDGTKVKANASLSRNRTYKSLCKKTDQLEEEIERMLKEGIEIDDEEDRLYGPDKRGDELPEGFRTRKEQLERLRKAKEELEEEMRKEAEAQEKKIEVRKEKEAELGRKLRGRKPNAPPTAPDEKAKRNTTDVDSRIMKTRTGHVQGYNAQAAVDVETQVIVAADVTQDCNDLHQGEPMLRACEENLGRMPERGLFDAGYWFEEFVLRMQDKVDLYVATNKDWKQRKAMRERPPPRGRIPKSATLKKRMERKLLTKNGREMYKKRAPSSEPVFGQIKDGRGLDSFLLRGTRKVNGEWNLMTMTHNLLKLWRSGALSGLTVAGCPNG